MIELEEYKNKKLSQSSINDRALNLLWEKYRKEVEVEFPSRKTDGQWQIKSKGWVGYIPLTPEIILYLKPKVEVGNIFRMLEYAYKFDDLEFGEGYINCDKIEDIYSHIANLLANRIIDRESQGLYRAYVPKTDYLTFVHGRIDIQNAIQKPWNIKLKCHYDEQTVDIEDNQILAWTLYIIIHSSLWTEQVPVPSSVCQAYHALQGLVTLKEFQPKDCTGRIYNYLNQDYQLLHSLCRFFLEGAGPSHQIGDRTMLPFLIDMADLYEHFVAEWLEQRLNKWLKQRFNEHLPNYSIESQEEKSHSNIKFKPDIVIYNSAKKPCYILDTKYKIPKSIEFRDVAQVIAYAVLTDCPEAVLVYPEHHKQLDIQVENIQVGNIRVRSLTFSLEDDNLGQAGDKLLEQLFPNSAKDLFNC